jgi:hypothetical protein
MSGYFKLDWYKYQKYKVYIIPHPSIPLSVHPSARPTQSKVVSSALRFDCATELARPELVFDPGFPTSKACPPFTDVLRPF